MHFAVFDRSKYANNSGTFNIIEGKHVLTTKLKPQPAIRLNALFQHCDDPGKYKCYRVYSNDQLKRNFYWTLEETMIRFSTADTTFNLRSP